MIPGWRCHTTLQLSGCHSVDARMEARTIDDVERRGDVVGPSRVHEQSQPGEDRDDREHSGVAPGLRFAGEGDGGGDEDRDSEDARAMHVRPHDEQQRQQKESARVARRGSVEQEEEAREEEVRKDLGLERQRGERRDEDEPNDEHARRSASGRARRDEPEERGREEDMNQVQTHSAGHAVDEVEEDFGKDRRIPNGSRGGVRERVLSRIARCATIQRPAAM